MAADLAVVPDPPAPATQRDIVDGWIPHAAAVFKLADHICDTSFVPDAYRGNAPAVAGAILTGRELGIGPMMALRYVQMVKGNPTLSAEYKRARVLAAGHEFDIVDWTLTMCRVSGRRRGSTKPPLVITYTMDDAKRARLIRADSAWTTRPRRMLLARAGTDLCDALFADVTLGLPTTELLEAGTDADAYAAYGETAGQAAAETETAAPRTARRKTAAAGPPAREQAREAPPAVRGDTPPGSGLPPLPGETEETPAGAAHQPAEPAAPAGPDPEPGDRDAKRRQKLTGIIKGHLERLGYPRPYAKDETDAERTARLADLATLAGIAEIGTSSDLDPDELSAAADTLARMRDRAALDAMLAAIREAMQDVEDSRDE